MNTVARRPFTERMIGAARFDVDVYEENQVDGTATGRAGGVMAMVAGFAQAPGVLCTLAIVPRLGWTVAVVFAIRVAG